jgi:serine/threonine protein kinase
MYCPSCFEQKPDRPECPHPECGFIESGRREPNLLPYRCTLQKGRFVIGQLMGRPGGYGVAYKALDKRDGIIVVIKECLLLASRQISRSPGQLRIVVAPGFEKAFQRELRSFRAEAQCIAGFSSEHIVRVRDVFDENGTAYYVMPFVDGQTLHEHCDEGDQPMSELDVQVLAVHLLSALEEMHAHDILHRDIKPSNILIRRPQELDDEEDHSIYDLRRGGPVLIDFGAARRLVQPDGTPTQAPAPFWTPGYGPIEQLPEGQLSQQGPWSDIYALCATLYFCLVGRAPTTSKKRASRLEAQGDTYVPLRTRLPHISRNLADMIDGGLQLDPKRRLQCVDEARNVLMGKPPVPAVDARTAATPSAAPSPRAAPADMTPARHAPAPPRRTPAILGLLPALAVALGSVASSGTLLAYLNGWPGLAILANIGFWVVWVSRRKAPSPPSTTASQPTATAVAEANRPETRVPAPTPSPGATAAAQPPVLGIEIRLDPHGAPSVVRQMQPGDRLLVGRTDRSDLAIPNRYLSGQHVSIEALPQGRFRLVDLDSLNHTFELRPVDGEETPQWCEVEAVTGEAGRFVLGPYNDEGVSLEIMKKAIAS